MREGHTLVGSGHAVAMWFQGSACLRHASRRVDESNPKLANTSIEDRMGNVKRSRFNH